MKMINYDQSFSALARQGVGQTWEKYSPQATSGLLRVPVWPA